jgi:hypothetical protein|tara:strand:- start:232 stop:564 length:333 start_codon:yes stop_codon:yes gene_type:complete
MILSPTELRRRIDALGVSVSTSPLPTHPAAIDAAVDALSAIRSRALQENGLPFELHLAICDASWRGMATAALLALPHVADPDAHARLATIAALYAAALGTLQPVRRYDYA